MAVSTKYHLPAPTISRMLRSPTSSAASTPSPRRRKLELKALKWGAQGRVQGPWALLRHWRRLRGYGDGTDRRAARRQGGARVPGAAYSRFEVAVVSTVIRIKAANRALPIAA